MCGIFGFYLNRKISDNEINLAKKTLKVLSHRGPDFSDFYLDKKNGIFLGHTRLSIVDLSKKNNQPFIKNKSVLIYNGEIYNYHELKRTILNNDYNFITKGDTEVLFEILQLKDFSKLKLIDGMFAFAFLDDKKLYLARDIFGEKPLYIHQNKNGVFFSSEPKAIINFCDLKKQINDKSINEFINFGYNFKNKFFDIADLECGNILEIINGKITNQKQFDSVSTNLAKNSFRNINEFDTNYVKQILIDSIQNRLNSDVSLGLLLSSGNDSSLVAALLKKELNYDFETVTYSFKNKKYDETYLVDKICKFLKIKNHKIKKEVNLSSNVYKQAIKLFDEPNDSITGINVYNICSEMKKFFKVGLTGMGGDEMFYGYYKHNFFYKYQNILTNSFIKKFTKLFGFFNNGYINKYNSYNYDNYIEIILSLKNNPYFNNKQINNFFDMNEYSQLLKNNKFDLMSFFIFFDINYDLKNSIIPGIERGSMKASTELRTPYLNKKLQNYISDFNYNDILRNGQKWIQKKILSEYLPKEIINNTKMGFINPPILNSDMSKKIDENQNINFAIKNIKNDNRWNRYILRSKIIDEFVN